MEIEDKIYKLSINVLCVAPYVVEKASCDDGVMDMIFHTVNCIEDCTYSALRILGAAVFGILLRNDGNAAVGCHLQGICQTSNATTQNKEVILLGVSICAAFQIIRKC